MKYENSLTIFIFSLIVSLYLYFVASISSFKAIKFYGEIIAVIVFAVALLGLFISSFKRRSLSYFYYLGLFAVSLLILLFSLIFTSVDIMTQYYFVLAVLIALLLSLLDFRYIISAKSRIIADYRNQLSKMKNVIDKLQAELQKQKDESSKKTAEIRKTKGQIAGTQAKANKFANELKKSEKRIAEITKRADKFKERSGKLAEDKKKFAKFKKGQELLQRKLARSQKEINKQAELKSQYSKTLANIRKRKKEAEELLVVSSDGKSVHRPKCIAVRHLTKEKRKLIKNWKIAQKEGYIGCGLCKPHIKPAVVVKDNVKYKFVGSKDSDKVHKASCLLIKNISNKDREYFRTYRAAIKKKYTGCRVCNPEQ